VALINANAATRNPPPRPPPAMSNDQRNHNNAAPSLELYLTSNNNIDTHSQASLTKLQKSEKSFQK
jgi:hypothetical protein